jgi:hypothetical protein
MTTKKKTEAPARVEAPPLPSGKGVYAAAFEPRPDNPRTVVVARCLEDGDVEITVNDQPVGFDDGIILRWARRR